MGSQDLDLQNARSSRKAGYQTPAAGMEEAEK